MNRDQQRNDANLKHPPASPVAAQCFHVNTTPQADTERCLAAPCALLKLAQDQRPATHVQTAKRADGLYLALRAPLLRRKKPFQQDLQNE